MIAFLLSLVPLAAATALLVHVLRVWRGQHTSVDAETVRLEAWADILHEMNKMGKKGRHFVGTPVSTYVGSRVGGRAPRHAAVS